MHPSGVTKMEIEPLLVSIPQTSQLIGRCAATIYELVGAGRPSLLSKATAVP